MRYKLFIFAVLASIGFFNPHQMLSLQAQKVFFYLAILACLGISLKDGVSLKGVKYPRYSYLALLFGVGFSAIMSSMFYPQPLSVSILTTTPYFLAYSFFYILMKFDIPRVKIINAYMILCGIAVLVYFGNVVTMPNNFFGEPVISDDITRGIIRIPVVFIEFFPMIIFYAINQWLLNKKKKWLWVIAVGMMMVVLSVIRQVIALTTVLGLLFMFRNVSWKKKALMILAVFAVIKFVLPAIPIYNAMLELSETQKEENEDTENIRIQAWRYYTYENQKNTATAIFGNGMPAFGQSLWGNMMQSETDDNGCYFVDVGWAGMYWLFGIISTLALLIMLIKALLKKKSEDMKYLNYWLIFVMITSFASGPPVIYYQIIDIMVCLYLVFKKDDNADDSTDSEEITSLKAVKQKLFPQFGKIGNGKQ